MNIDMSKVNLSERDIEDWLYANPDRIPASKTYGPTIYRWIGRQYALPSGIADLIGIRTDGTAVVVEIKNVAINKAAILQVLRYQHDMALILGKRKGYADRASDSYARIGRIVIGPSIDDQTFHEAFVTGVQIIQFAPSVSLSFSVMKFQDKHEEHLIDQIETISNRNEWDIFDLQETDEEVDEEEPETASESDLYGPGESEAEREGRAKFFALWNGVIDPDQDEDETDSELDEEALNG